MAESDVLEKPEVKEEEENNKKPPVVETTVPTEDKTSEKKEDSGVVETIKKGAVEVGKAVDTGLTKLGESVRYMEDVQNLTAVAPIFGFELAATQTPGGIAKKETTISPEAQAQISEKEKIESLSLEEFKAGVRDGTITNYAGEYFQPDYADGTDIVDFYNFEIAGKQQEVTTPSGEKITGTTEPSVPYGVVTTEGKRQFTPTTKDVEKMSKEELVFSAKSKIADLVEGQISKRPGFQNVDPVGTTRVENILIQRISTNEFIPVLQDRLKEIGRGTILEGSVFLGAYLDPTSDGNIFTDVLPLMSQGASLSEAFAMTEKDRQKKINEIRTDMNKFGIRQLSDTINSMVRETLKEQMDNGEISPERFKQLTEKTTADGTTLPLSYVTEETAQNMLEVAFKSLSSPEQFALINFETFGGMLSAGAMASATAKTAGKTLIKDVKDKMEKTPALKKFGVAGAAYHLKTTGAMKEINLGVLRRALHQEKSDRYFSRLDNTIEDNRTKLSQMALRGETGSTDFNILRNQTEKLVTRRFKEKVVNGLGVFAGSPIIKANIKESFPLAIAQYYGAMAFQATGIPFVDSEVDQFGGEALGALTYIMGGSYLVKGAGSKLGAGARFVLSRPIDGAVGKGQSFGKFLETNRVTTGFLNLINKKLGRTYGGPFGASEKPPIGVRGLFSNRTLEEYDASLINERGYGLTRQERQNVNYVLELASVMDDKHLIRTLDTITNLSTMEAKFVNSFPAELQDEATEVYRTGFSTQSRISGLEAAGALATNKLNLRKLANSKNINTIMDIEDENRKLVRQNMLAIKGLKDKMSRSGVNLETTSGAMGFLDAMEQAQIKFMQRIDNNQIRMLNSIRKAKRIYFEDPTIKVPDDMHGEISDIENRIIESLSPEQQKMVGEKIIEIGKQAEVVFERAVDVNQSLITRADNLKSIPADSAKYLEGAGLLVEEFATSKLIGKRKFAARGFKDISQLAERNKKFINMTSAVDAMAKMNKEMSDINRLFSAEGLFFSGSLGRRSRAIMSKMARRAMDNIPDNVRSDLENLASLKQIKGPDGKLITNDDYISDQPTAFDIALHYAKKYEDNNVPMEERKFTPFLATPGELNTMHSAFVEHAYKMGNESLAAQYISYGEKLDDLVKNQAREYYNQYKEAKQIYQNEWFDRIRVGVLKDLLKAKRGPQRAATKITEERVAKYAGIEDITLDDEGLGILTSQTGFRFAWENKDPLTVFNPIVNNLDKALKGDIVAQGSVKKAFEDLAYNFGDRIAGKPGFDLTTPEGNRNFELASKIISTVMRAKFASKVVGDIDRLNLNPRSKAVLQKETGGYDFSVYPDLDILNDKFKFTVREFDRDGKIVVREKNVLDLGDILTEQKDIVTMMNKYPPLQQKYQQLVKEFDDQKDILTRKGKTEDKIEQFIFKQVEDVSNMKGDPVRFYDEYVTRGTPAKLQKLKDKLMKELTTDADGVTAVSPSERKVFEKNINEGIANLIARGSMENAGIKNVGGLSDTRDLNFTDIDDYMDQGVMDKYKHFKQDETIAQKITSGVGVTKPAINGGFVTTKFVQSPAQMLDDFRDADKNAIFREVMDTDHMEYYENMLEYMTMIQKGDFSQVKLEGLTRGISTNEAISRAFNLARGMVSPTYVAAEFAVRIAEQAGINLLGLVAQDKEAGRILVDIFKVGVKPSPRDIGTFSTKLTNFVFMQLSRAGLKPPEFVPQSHEELEEATKQMKRQFINRGANE